MAQGCCHGRPILRSGLERERERMRENMERKMHEKTRLKTHRASQSHSLESLRDNRLSQVFFCHGDVHNGLRSPQH